MTKYLVSVREVHINHIVIEATSSEEAKILVDNDRTLGDEVNLEYSHDLDKEFWGVTKYKED